MIKKDVIWRHVVECAVFGSIDYSQAIPKIEPCNEARLETCITEYISRSKNCLANDANRIYRETLHKAYKGEKPNKKYIDLARIGSTIGVVSLVVLTIAFIATFFNLVFLAFLLMAISFIITCNNYIKVATLREKAIKIWTEALQTVPECNMNEALSKMEQLFMKK